MSNTYPVNTIEQMAAIPREAQARFLAELPLMLNGIKAAEFTGKKFLNATWTDDGRLVSRTHDLGHK